MQRSMLVASNAALSELTMTGLVMLGAFASPWAAHPNLSLSANLGLSLSGMLVHLYSAPHHLLARTFERVASSKEVLEVAVHGYVHDMSSTVQCATKLVHKP